MQIKKNLKAKLMPLLWIALALGGFGGVSSMKAEEHLPEYLAEAIRNEQGQLIGYKCKGACGKNDLCCTPFPG